MWSAWMVAALAVGSWPDASPHGVTRCDVDVIELNHIVSRERSEMPNGQVVWRLTLGPTYVNYRRWDAFIAWYRVMAWSVLDEPTWVDYVRGRPVCLVRSRVGGMCLVRGRLLSETYGWDTEVAERQWYEKNRVPSQTPGLKGLKR